MDLGLERAGLECSWQVEIDDYCRRVLSRHWPHVPRFSDISLVDKTNLPSVDMICGGFPCQDISYAGLGKGIEGERSGLWTQFDRVICELRPRIVLVENVSALLTRGLDKVLGDLATSGYHAEWDCLPAAAVGAPHRRDRVFILAYSESPERWESESGFNEPCGEIGEWQEKANWVRASGPNGGKEDVADTESQSQRAGLREGESRGERGRRFGNGRCAGDLPDPNGIRRRERGAGRSSGSVAGVCKRRKRQEENLPYADRQRLAVGEDQERLREFQATIGTGQWAIEPDVGRMVDGVSSRMDSLGGIPIESAPKPKEGKAVYAGRIHRIKGLGNAVVPQVAEFVGLLIKARLEQGWGA